MSGSGIDTGGSDGTGGGLVIDGGLVGGGLEIAAMDGACGEATEANACGSGDRGSSWLVKGVGSCGVNWSGSSSSDDDSSIDSSWRCNSRSRSLAASSSARWAASRSSFSLVSLCAAFRCFRSSSFLSLPCRTCSSSAFRRASLASRSFRSSSSCCRSWFLEPILAHVVSQ